ncbi:MAG: hypothetical protein C0424_09445 [Sphingobacteriaceae bacterium]|nr:hypothetical protein [Sphingobacteriaceae bacterium]
MKHHDQLHQLTLTFLNDFLNKRITHPIWSRPWDLSSEIPNQSKRGCYAILSGDEVIYIGVALGKSTQQYAGAGLGDRLKRYWQLNPNRNALGQNRYQFRDDWKEATTLVTLAFEEEYFYLAAALEIYLIRELKPRRNAIHA